MSPIATTFIGLFSILMSQDLPEPRCSKYGDICYEQLSVKPKLYYFRPYVSHHGIKFNGSVTVMFDVTDTGTVTNMKILKSSQKGVFDRATLKMLLKNRYYPEAVKGVKARYVFKNDNYRYKAAK